MAMTYDERRAARQTRIEAKAARLETEMNEMNRKARAISDMIPFGQPILVGHHSEGRHRRDLAKIRKLSSQECETARELAQVEASAPTTAVLAGDADAVEVLAARLAAAEAEQVRMKAANKLVAKNDAAGLEAMGFTSEQAAELLTGSKWERGFPAYRLTNNNANIRRMRERLTQLQAAKAKPSTEREVNGVRVVEDTEAMRLRLIFPGKPAPEIIAELKSWGFRWAPSAGAWQLNLHNRARHAAECVLAKLATPVEA